MKIDSGLLLECVACRKKRACIMQSFHLNQFRSWQIWWTASTRKDDTEKCFFLQNVNYIWNAVVVIGGVIRVCLLTISVHKILFSEKRPITLWIKRLYGRVHHLVILDSIHTCTHTIMTHTFETSCFHSVKVKMIKYDFPWNEKDIRKKGGRGSSSKKPDWYRNTRVLQDDADDVDVTYFNTSNG